MSTCGQTPDRDPDVALELFSQARFLSGARALVSNVAQRVGFPEHQCGQISLAIDEALCNVIKHGYNREPDGRIWLSLWVLEPDDENQAPGICLIIEDRAQQIDPDQIKSRDLDDIRPGGLGVFIINEIMDQVSYEKRDGGGMRLCMRKRVASIDTLPSAADDVNPAAAPQQKGQS